jgi:hypothetical protein
MRSLTEGSGTPPDRMPRSRSIRLSAASLGADSPAASAISQRTVAPSVRRSLAARVSRAPLSSAPNRTFSVYRMRHIMYHPSHSCKLCRGTTGTLRMFSAKSRGHSRIVNRRSRDLTDTLLAWYVNYCSRGASVQCELRFTRAPDGGTPRGRVGVDGRGDPHFPKILTPSSF